MQGRGDGDTAQGSMTGIYKAHSLMSELRSIKENGLDRGVAPGKSWKKFSYRYRVKRGMMTIVTGIPASGKSEFVDAMLTNIAIEEGWRFALFSPENYPITLHLTKLLEKYVGKPFHDPLLPSMCMTSKDALDAALWADGHFSWIYPDAETEAVTLDVILSKALVIHETTGIDGLVIDPWNELEVQRAGMSEADFISASLTKIRRWARKHNIHVWIIVHPHKLEKNKQGTYDPPTPYEINGGAMWRNKADFMLCVHRADPTRPFTQVFIQKVKFKHLGELGMVEFEYTKSNGRYAEVES